MPHLPPREKRERAVRKLTVPAAALAHLIVFALARRGGGWAWWAAPLAASSAAASAYLVIRDLLSARKRDRLPDVHGILAWGAALLLESSALYPFLSGSRIVPAVLFPAFGFLMRPASMAAYSAAALAWLLFSPDWSFPAADWSVSIAGIAGIGLAAGRMVRRKIGDAGTGKELVEEALRESRLLVHPWENPDAAEGGAAPATVEQMGLLRSREEAMEGVRRILEGIEPVAGADTIMFVLPSAPPGRSFSIGAGASGGADAGNEGSSIPDDYTPVREAMLFRRTYIAEGEEAGKWPIVSAAGKGRRPTGVAASPVCIEGKSAGAVLAVRYDDGEWSEPVVQLIEMAAFLAAREIERAKRRYAMDRYLANQEGFHRLVRRIAEISEGKGGEEKVGQSLRKEVYRVAVEQARRHLDVARVMLVEADKGGGRGRIAWESAETASGERDEWVSLEGTYAEWVLRQGIHRMFTGEQASSGRFSVLPAEWAAGEGNGFLLVPVADTGGFRGILACEAAGGRRFEGEDAESARDILAIMRMGISHALRLETLETEAKNDGLTGLLNKKTFHVRLTNVLSRLDGRYPCSVIMLDIDHFKRVNDTYGHPAGDEVLRKISGVIGKTVRKVDMAGRYGGEEFSIYLHSTDRRHAVQIAERLRLIIRQTRFVFDGKEVGVTASFGVACHPEHGHGCDDLIRHADEALYKSKQGGRDRVTVFGGSGS